ncbi:MAG: hypothetical protein IKW00_04630 [Clostridia bacterium]|nr:hypothetical protein [Clostridia bacterium]
MLKSEKKAAADEIKKELEKINAWNNFWQTNYDSGDYDYILELGKKVLLEHHHRKRLRAQWEEENAEMLKKVEEIRERLIKIDFWFDFYQKMYDDEQYELLIRQAGRCLEENEENRLNAMKAMEEEEKREQEERKRRALERKREEKEELERETREMIERVKEEWAEQQEAEMERRLAAKRYKVKSGGGLLSGLLNIFLSEDNGDRCDGDCDNCPSHYGYRYGRWYYGHGHMHGCERGGNGGASGRTLRN